MVMAGDRRPTVSGRNRLAVLGFDRNYRRIERQLRRSRLGWASFSQVYVAGTNDTTTGSGGWTDFTPGECFRNDRKKLTMFSVTKNQRFSIGWYLNLYRDSSRITLEPLGESESDKLCKLVS
jgi:hypothetical protein